MKVIKKNQMPDHHTHDFIAPNKYFLFKSKERQLELQAL